VIQLPEVAVPKKVSSAAALVVEREADVKAARETVEEAKTAISAAVAEDRAAYADALDIGRDDPGTPAEDAARARLGEAERKLAGEELRMTRAREQLDAALQESAEQWTAAIEKATVQAETRVLSLLDELEAAERERARRRHALGWVHAFAENRKLPSLDHTPDSLSTLPIEALAGPQPHTVLALLDFARAGVEKATLTAERASDAEHAQRLHVA
jgi:hypothetical protein